MESRVRIVHTESSTVMGGQERRVLAESLGMRDRGHDIWVVSPPDGALAKRAAAVGLEVVPMSFRRSLLPLNARALGAAVRRLQPDVVNTHSSADSWTMAVARHLGPRPGALVRSRHISARVKPGPLHGFLYGEADFVITTGESVRRSLTESGLVPSERSMSIPTGVDLDRFRPRPEERAKTLRSLGLDGGGPVLGVVAYLRPDKGHAVLLSSMPKILEKHPLCSLVVVGDGPERVRLEALVARLGIETSVRFVGLREDVPSLLCALDAFCLPSVKNEGVPQSVLQASAVGLPVVSTAVGGIPEAVLDQVTGFVVPPADPDLLAHALSTLIADPQLRRRLGEAGRRHITASFSELRMLDLTEQAYATALCHAASRGRKASSALPGS
jgi:glycosyltransferase involved in cell wall biosynthesis